MALGFATSLCSKMVVGPSWSPALGTPVSHFFTPLAAIFCRIIGSSSASPCAIQWLLRRTRRITLRTPGAGCLARLGWMIVAMVVFWMGCFIVAVIVVATTSATASGSPDDGMSESVGLAI